MQNKYITQFSKKFWREFGTFLQWYNLQSRLKKLSREWWQYGFDTWHLPWLANSNIKYNVKFISLWSKTRLFSIQATSYFPSTWLLNFCVSARNQIISIFKLDFNTLKEKTFQCNWMKNTWIQYKITYLVNYLFNFTFSF